MERGVNRRKALAAQARWRRSQIAEQSPVFVSQHPVIALPNVSASPNTWRAEDGAGILRFALNDTKPKGRG
jgi:hypothetical protein